MGKYRIKFIFLLLQNQIASVIILTEAIGFLFVFCCGKFSLHIELFVSEIKSNIDGDFDEVKYIEKEAEIEDKARRAHIEHLYDLACDSECIADEQEYFEKQALSLCGTGYVGLTNGNRPGETEAEYCQSFE